MVNALQAVFAQTWMGETGEVLIGARYFPAQAAAGDVAVHVVASSPRGGVSSSSLLYRLMISAAQREVLIQNPYFAPSPEVVRLLLAAIGRGVRVRILTAGPRTDSRLVRWAGHFVFPELLRGGAEIHEFQPTLNHQKIMVVDRDWCYLGSANFDERSFDINAEVGLGILDRGVCDTLADAFERDLQRARRMTPDALAAPAAAQARGRVGGLPDPRAALTASASGRTRPRSATDGGAVAVSPRTSGARGTASTRARCPRSRARSRTVRTRCRAVRRDAACR